MQQKQFEQEIRKQININKKMKEIAKIKVKINETGNRKPVEKTSEARVDFFKR